MFVGVIVLVGQGCYLAHLLRNAIQKETLHIGFLITESADELSMIATNIENGVSYDVEKRELYYVIEGKEIIRELDKDVSNYWVMSMPIYDVRDTSEWTLEALDTMVQRKLEKQKTQVLAMRLTERDSTGRVLRTFGEEREGKGVACHYEQEMGYLTRNMLEADYVIPYAAIWEETKDEAMLVGIIAVLTVCCLVLLYRYFRIEGENARMREFYMSMYRHDLRSPISAILTRVCSLKIAEQGRLTEKEGKGLEAISLAAKRVGKGIE